MSKRNISYVKPKDPSFLAKLKAEIGYNEGPTIDTKKQKLEDENSDSGGEIDREDEKPQIVVLKSGDLTAEEVTREEERLAREAAEVPADLNQRIIFKKKSKQITEEQPTTTADNKKSKKKKSKESNKLSFAHNEDEEEDF